MSNDKDKMAGQVIEFGGKKYIVKKKKDKDEPEIIAFSQDYCTGISWPPNGGECAAGFTPYEDNGEICCRWAGEGD